MPTIFSYVLGRPSTLQTIEEYTVAVEESPAQDEPTPNTTILEDSPES